MALVSSSIPNLVSGVSQQPAPSRLQTSGQKMVNGFPSVVSGLMKRPPTEFVAQLSPSMNVLDGSAVHFIDRDTTERYILICGEGDLELYSETGVKQTVTFPDGKSYLPTSTPWKYLRFVTVADTTFVLNTLQQVQKTTLTDTRTDPTTRASVFVKKAVPSQTYAIYLNNTLIAETTTRDNTTASTSLEGTAEIAAELRDDLIANGYTDAKVNNTTVTFGITSGDTLAVLDEFGGGAMTPYVEELQTFDDLPPGEEPGRLVKIVGKEDTTNPYWVQFKAKGVWQETVGYDEKVELDASTMPHVLVKTAPNTFEFRQNNWKERPVGDDTTNPVPSYVGKTIKNLFLFKGRLGMLAGENVVMSTVGNFEQQFRTTVIQVLPEDRIDVASATGRIDTLRHAATFSDELVLFSNRQQFRLTSQETLSADTVGIAPTTAYPCSRHLPPQSVGDSVYFMADGPTHSVGRELFVDGVSNKFKADDITVQIPSYIPQDAKVLTGSPSADALFVLSANEKDVLYLHKWYSVNDEKVQSAWCKWQFEQNRTIISAGFFDDYLYIVYKLTGNVRIDKVLVGPIIDKDLLLDCQITDADFTTFSYDGGTDLTTIVIPYDHPDTLSFHRTDDLSLQPYEVTRVTDTTYTVQGDITGDSITAGVNYKFRYEFSHQYLRDSGDNGQSAIQDGRLQLRYFSLIYTDSSYFKVEVTPDDNEKKTYEFSGRILGDPDNILNEIPLDTGEFKFPVFAENNKVKIEIISDQPYKCAFGTVEWSAMFRPRTKRL